MAFGRLNLHAALALGLAGPLLPAAPARSDPALLIECRAIAEDAARLACYDRLAKAQAVPAKPEAAPPAPGPASPGVAEPTPEELFGHDPATSEAMVREAAGIGRVDEIRSRVAAVRSAPDGKLVLTLDNNQVWAQLDSPAPGVAPGAEVSIRRAAFGSYLLSVAGTPRGIRVRRVR